MVARAAGCVDAKSKANCSALGCEVIDFFAFGPRQSAESLPPSDLEHGAVRIKDGHGNGYQVSAHADDVDRLLILGRDDRRKQ